jgi:hypothetical protein
MSRRLVYAFATAALAMYATAPTPAPARWLDPATAGYCASGTCGKYGGRRAINVKNCSAEYCREYVASAARPPAERPAAATRKTACQPTYWPWSWFWPRQDCVAANEK